MTGAEPEAIDAGADPEEEAEVQAGCVAAVLSGPVVACPGSRRPPDRRPPDRRPPRRWDRGSATAEMAVALPALLVLLAAGIAAVSAVTVKMQCVSAAREGALSAARGGSGADAAREAAPGGASVSVSVDGERVRATVSAQVRPFGLFEAVTVDATAVAAVEPGTP